MPYKDLHEAPFDSSTIAKLEIFEDYAQAWLPTFIMNGAKTLCVFDFFAGTGYDKNGVDGSPIRILNKIKEQIGNIFQQNVKVKLYLNEWEPNKKEQPKFTLLKKACEDFLSANPDVKRAIDLELSNENFEVLFSNMLPIIRQFPSLVYLDQNGIKFLSDKYFLELEKTSQTDFLYFVSASYFWRFGDKKEFKMHLDLDMALAKKDPYRFIHRNLIGQIDLLRRTGARTKFLSCEPLIGSLPNLNLDSIDWVIVGGESGRVARPMNEEWVLDIMDQCNRADVAFFFKQWGGINKKKSGRLLNGRTYDEMPFRVEEL